MSQLNQEQQAAYDDIVDFIKNGNHKDEYITVQSPAGCGKSYLLARVVESMPNRRFIVSAISHKAKEVIFDRINARNVKAMTIAALLAMKFDDETGNFFEDPYETELPIADADIVIVDEASMINRKSLEYMFSKKMYRTVLIFAGDIGQIRPIGASKLNEFSPIFNTPNIIHLTERVRQGEGNPILAHMDVFWHMAQNPKPYIGDVWKEDSTNEMGSIVYKNDMRKVINEYLPYFQQALDEKNTNIIKVVAYKNDSRKLINTLIRESLFGEDREEYEIGELMIMADTYRDEFSKVENSVEFVINSIKEKQVEIHDYLFEYYQLEGIHKSLSGKDFAVTVPVIKEKEKERFTRLSKKLFAEAKEYPAKTAERKQKMAEAWGLTRLFAKADYGYAITAHRSQGSTYERVIVNLTDMLRAYHLNDQEKASLIYTAGTRAKREVVMVNKNFDKSHFPDEE